MSVLRALMARQVRTGRVDWIGARLERRALLRSVASVTVSESGLDGDHARPGKRAVTLIQAEHLPVITALAERAATPERLRRNIVVSGLNLATLRGREIRTGAATFEITGPCTPCSRMEEELGAGGYQAVRHHGGWCARVVVPGAIALGCEVAV